MSQSVQCFGKKKTATAVAQCKVRSDSFWVARRYNEFLDTSEEVE